MGSGAVGRHPPAVPLWACVLAYVAAMATNWVVSAVLFFVSTIIGLSTQSGLMDALAVFVYMYVIIGLAFPALALVLLPLYVICMALWQRQFARRGVFYVSMILFNVAICLVCEGILSLFFQKTSLPHMIGIHAGLAALAGVLGGSVGWTILKKRQAAARAA